MLGLLAVQVFQYKFVKQGLVFSLIRLQLILTLQSVAYVIHPW